MEGVAVTVGEGLIVTELVEFTEGHVPLKGIVLVMVNVPEMLDVKFICPVFTLSKTKPAGATVKLPALAPGPKVGKGLLSYWQKGEPE